MYPCVTLALRCDIVSPFGTTGRFLFVGTFLGGAWTFPDTRDGELLAGMEPINARLFVLVCVPNPVGNSPPLCDAALLAVHCKFGGCKSGTICPVRGSTKNGKLGC